MAAGLVLIAAGAALWLRRPGFEVPVPADYASADADLKVVIDEQLARATAAPDDAKAIGFLALAYEANRLWREAEACYARAAELDAATPMWPHHQAVAIFHGGDTERARTLLRTVVQRFPSYPPAHAFLGDLALESGDVAEARAEFEQVVATAPQSAEGHAGLADVLLREGDAAGAKESAQKAIALDPTYKAPHFLLGRALAKLGEDERATAEMKLGEDAQKRRMGDPLTERIGEFAAKVDAQLDRAAVLLHWKRFADAEKLLRTIERRYPNDARVHVRLGSVLLELQRPEESLASLQRALALAPNDLQVRLELAACNLALRRPRDAHADAKQAVELAPDSPRACFLLSQASFGIGDRDAALAWMEKASTLVPDDAVYLSQLGALYRGLGRMPEAARTAERLTELMPGRWEPWADLAQFRLRQDDVAGAEVAYEKALALAEDDAPLAPLGAELAKRKGN